MVCDKDFSKTLKGIMAPWFLGDLDEFVANTDKIRSGHDNLYPPHNVYKVDERTLVLQMALAGIDPDDLKLASNGDCFTISYTPSKTDKHASHQQYKSISTRRFSKTFKLEDAWEVTNATLNNGLLEVTVSRVDKDEKYIEIKLT